MKKYLLPMLVILLLFCSSLTAGSTNAITEEPEEMPAIYIKTEPDGDFELLFENYEIWYYIQVLGDNVVESKSFAEGTTEQDIVKFLGSRANEFKRIEYIESFHPGFGRGFLLRAPQARGVGLFFSCELFLTLIFFLITQILCRDSVH